MSTYKRRTKLNLKTKPRKVKSIVLHVAVVISDGFCRKNHDGDFMSKRPRGDWGAFINPDKATVIKQAQDAAEEWSHQYGAYKILIGTLTNKIHQPVMWREEPLFE